MLCNRFSSALSAGLISVSTVGDVATENGSEGGWAVGGEVEGCVLLLWLLVSVVFEVEFRGRGMGETASAPNWASRNMKRRVRRVEGSGVLCGFGCLKRCVSFWDMSSSGAGECECECERDDSIDKGR